MTLGDIERLLQRITYKPCTSFALEKDILSGCVLLLLRAKRTDADDHKRNTTVHLVERLDAEKVAPWDEKYFVSFLRDMVERFEHHEVCEFLRFDGRHVTEPHPNE